MQDCKDCNGKGRTVKSCKGKPCFCYPTCETCNGTGKVPKKQE